MRSFAIALVLLIATSTAAWAGRSQKVVLAKDAKQKKIVTTGIDGKVTFRVPGKQPLTRDGKRFLGVTRVQRVAGKRSADGAHTDYEVGPGKYNITKRNFFVFRTVHTVEVVDPLSLSSRRP